MQVRDVKANLNQIGFDINLIHEMVSGLVSTLLDKLCQYGIASKDPLASHFVIFQLLLNLAGRED